MVGGAMRERDGLGLWAATVKEGSGREESR